MIKVSDNQTYRKLTTKNFCPLLPPWAQNEWEALESGPMLHNQNQKMYAPKKQTLWRYNSKNHKIYMSTL